MPNRRSLLPPLWLAPVVALFLSGSVMAAGTTVVGTGRLQSEVRPVQAFEAIVLRGAVRLTMRPANVRPSRCAPTTTCCR